MAKIEKRFDAVRMMRSIRDELDEKIRGMTLEQQQTYIRQRLRAGSTDRINGAGIEDDASARRITSRSIS